MTQRNPWDEELACAGSRLLRISSSPDHWARQQPREAQADVDEFFRLSRTSTVPKSPKVSEETDHLSDKLFTFLRHVGSPE
jgi:hypothetical protein